MGSCPILGPRVVATLPLHDRAGASLRPAERRAARWDALRAPPSRRLAPTRPLDPRGSQLRLRRWTPGPPPADRTGAAKLDPGVGQEPRQAIPHRAMRHPGFPMAARPPASRARLAPSMGRRPVRRMSRRGRYRPRWWRRPRHRSGSSPWRSMPGPIPRVAPCRREVNRSPDRGPRTPSRPRSAQGCGFPVGQAGCPQCGAPRGRPLKLRERQARPTHQVLATRRVRRLRWQALARPQPRRPVTTLRPRSPDREMARRLADGR